MNDLENALPPEGGAELTQNPPSPVGPDRRDRPLLALTMLFCLFVADTFPLDLFNGGMTALVLAWYLLVFLFVRPAGMSQRSNQLLFLTNLLLAWSLVLTSSLNFRVWNALALLALVPLHAVGLSGAGRLPWWRPAMLWERLCLLIGGLFGRPGDAFAVLSPSAPKGRRTAAWALGLGAAALLAAALLPVLASADALFAAVTAELRTAFRLHFSIGFSKFLFALVLTPCFFGLLRSLRQPRPLTWELRRHTVQAPAFLPALAVLVLLYLLFLAVQSAGLFGGPAYLQAQGLSYAQWARSGFFQMVGVTVVNLSVLLATLTFARREGRSWRFLRGLAAVLVAESLVLLCSAAWRMTLYVTAYGLSFKRLLAYWGMGMMALFFLAALGKVLRPDFAFCKAAFPLALAGWLVLNCIPADYLVAKNQVDRYLDGRSGGAISVHYLAYVLSYDALSQLERLPDRPLAAYEQDWWDPEETLSQLLALRREAARASCSHWRTWSLSAWLAVSGGQPAT